MNLKVYWHASSLEWTIMRSLTLTEAREVEAVVGNGNGEHITMTPQQHQSRWIDINIIQTIMVHRIIILLRQCWRRWRTMTNCAHKRSSLWRERRDQSSRWHKWRAYANYRSVTYDKESQFRYKKMWWERSLFLLLIWSWSWDLLLFYQLRPAHKIKQWTTTKQTNKTNNINYNQH